MAFVAFVVEAPPVLFPDLDDRSPQDAIWVLSRVTTVPHKGWDGLCVAQFSVL